MTREDDDFWRERDRTKDTAAVSAVKDPCRAELCLDETTLRCQRTFNHEGIHEARVKDYSYLRWSYAGRRVLPLE